MATKNPRVNVTFEEDTIEFLCEIAKKKHISVSRLVRELALQALEIQEDIYFSALANKLDHKGAKTCKYEDWKQGKANEV